MEGFFARVVMGGTGVNGLNDFSYPSDFHLDFHLDSHNSS